MTDASPNDITLQTYEAAAERYRTQTATPGQAITEFLTTVASTAGPGAHVLELGSGPGHGALMLEQLGLHVARTDAARAFVEMMLADGHEARLLDIRTDDFGGPYDAVVADAVLLHLTPEEFATVARKSRDAVHAGGLFALTLKEGDGSEWRSDKLDLPRHFTYWRAPALREALVAAGWEPLSIEPVAAREPWLYALCRAS
jgi:cyclopropane fatty-acyl-phospholipid synthase-like methyltransferase